MNTSTSGFHYAVRRASQDGARGAYVVLGLACFITWQLSAPIAFVIWSGEAPPPLVLAFAGLSAFGPSLAALAIGGIRGELSEIFGRWRTRWTWIALGLCSMPLLHLPATLLEVALGGSPAQWFYPPVRAEHIAALVLFSIGEEFGWRGFAYPRLAERHGALASACIVGVAWSAWHFFMWFTPDGPPTLAAFSLGALHLTLASVIIAALFEKSGRSMAVAIALHASGHLDNVMRAPASELRLTLLRLLVLAVAAAFAARSLSRARSTS
jgi:membrane protease YdiL (CAAX protease family)